MKLAFSRWFFNQVHSRHLIYNQCWEDPAIDNEVLDIGPDDRLVMITSAGCNALDYLLRGPALIQCVDVNPHQNALLELKLAAIATLSYEQFFEMDWLSGAPELLDEEWRSIMDSASPGARIIYRSGTKTCDFIPGFATSRLQLHPWITEYLNTRDRVGTYASFHFAKVN